MPITTQKYNVPVFKKNQPDDSFKFQPVPTPSGAYPYHLSLADIQAIPNPQKLVFHMMGDTGCIRSIDFLTGVTDLLAKQFNSSDQEDRPLFLYHLGDVVYNHGEAAEYERQFFIPFQDYPAPIVAIPGNHDSDINPLSATPYGSLDAFKAVFCDSIPRTVSFSGNAKRKSMAQPNLYWTLETPLANIIGLYSNVPKFGIITDEQRCWLVEELRTANLQRPEKAVILCLHHSPYSADINHGASIPMIRFLEGVYRESGVRPDVVFSGHVHNYQRFLKQYPDGGQTTYIVAGAGGYDELHPVAFTSDHHFSPEHSLFKGVNLQHFCDDRRGFLKITLERAGEGVKISGNYYTLQPDPDGTDASDLILGLADAFVV